MFNNNGDTDRMHVSRHNGGGGLLDITDLYKTQDYLQRGSSHAAHAMRWRIEELRVFS